MIFAIQIAIWLIGFFLLWRIPTCSKPKRQSRRSTNEVAVPKVSVIIPARNEEGVLNKLLESLSAQTIPPYEVIVVNDNSTDRTGEMAKEFNSLVIDLESSPDGWLGKNWACFNGAKTATGSHLLFLDADTWLEKDGLERIIHCEAQNPGVITLSPYHVVRDPYENLSLFFNIMAGAGLRTFTMLSDRITPAGLFGPCFYCSRDDYFAIDGHSSVKGSIIEDVDIGRKFVEAGIPLRGFGGKETINVRMYPQGFRQLVQGWTKNIGIGATRTSPHFVLLISLWFGGSFKVVVDLMGDLFSIRLPSSKSVMLYGAYASQIRWMSLRAGSFPAWAALLFPIPLFFSGFIYFRSFLRYALGKEVKWKGRSLRTEETASNAVSS
jgi:4,4'-diaponeurosporenoate glycosyltransferase